MFLKNSKTFLKECCSKEIFEQAEMLFERTMKTFGKKL
jgi:hypothetical protein